jgi:hypothetical protein
VAVLEYRARAMRTILLNRSRHALLASARNLATEVEYDPRGYTARWQDNLFPGLPVAEIEQDFGAGAGQELDGKFCAAHSSAALAVNAFGPWRNGPAALRVAGLTGFRSLRFEVTCPTGLGGTPPHLDVLADGTSILAIESKCTEWMVPKVARFSLSYDSLRISHGHSPWFELIQDLRINPSRFEFLDAAQLVKHALGLLACYSGRAVRLLYLYWEPGNAEDWPECQRHRAEAEDFANQVRTCCVQLVPMTYRELWSEWSLQCKSSHLEYLRGRYDCAI